MTNPSRPIKRKETFHQFKCKIGILSTTYDRRVKISAFVTPDGYNGYIRYPFKLVNISAVFQYMVNKAIGNDGIRIS